MGETRYSLLLERDLPVDPRKYGTIVAPALGLTVVEARLAVRRGRGVFLENLAEEQARRIAAELEKDGIGVRVVAQDRLPALPPMQKVVHLDSGEEALSYALPGTGAREAVAWGEFRTVSCGVVAKPRYQDLFAHVPFSSVPAIHQMEGRERDMVRENLILKMGAAPPPKELSTRRKPESIFEEIEQKYGTKVNVYADLLGETAWLRVPMDQIGYVFVADGVRLGGCWGFQLLVNDLREHCPGAFTEMTLKLLEAADIRELVFPAVEEFNRYTAWSAWTRILWPNAASSSPSPEPPASSTDGGSSSASPGPAPPSTSS